MSEINLKEDNLTRKNRTIKPFIDIYGKEYPFGEVGEDGVYKIMYDDVMDGEHGGYMMKPIYGVSVSTYFNDYLATVRFDENNRDVAVKIVGKISGWDTEKDDDKKEIDNYLSKYDYIEFTCSAKYKKGKAKEGIDKMVSELRNGLSEDYGLDCDKYLTIDLSKLYKKESTPCDKLSKEKEYSYVSRRYMIFIGEAPHMDDDGNWVTYNDVPKFYVDSFSGAHFIDKDESKPHFVRIIVEEFAEEQRRKKEIHEDNRWRELQEALDESFGKAFKMIWHVFKKKWKKFSPYIIRYVGNHATAVTFYPKWLFGNKIYMVQYVYEHDGSEKHFVAECGEWNYWLFLKEKNKWCWRTNKTYNDNTGCSL